MRIVEIDTLEDLQTAEAGWKELHGADPEAHFFLSWPWIFGQLRQSPRPWTVLCAKSGNDRPGFSGLMPLRIGTVISSDGRVVNKLSLIGNGASDYAGILCAPGEAEQVADSFWKHLEGMHWSELHLDYMFFSQRRRRAFLQGVDLEKFAMQRMTPADGAAIDHTVCPYVALPESFDAYLSGLGGNTRQKIRRLLREIEQSEDYAIAASVPDTIDSDIAAFLELWWQRWGGQYASGRDETIARMKAGLLLAQSSGALSLVSLWSHGERVAMQANIHDSKMRRVHFYAAARAPDFEDLPAGLALHAHCIRSAITDGFQIYDFMHGNDRYKRAFGTEDRRLERLVILTRDGANLGGKLDRRTLARVVAYADRIANGGDGERAKEILGQVLTTDPENANALAVLERVEA